MEVKPRSEAFGKTAASVGVQSVLFNSEVEHLDRSVSALARAAELAIRQGACSRVGLQYGDCSQQRCIPERAVQDMQKQYEGVLTIRYCFFAENLGSARGHNNLAKLNEYEFILIQNPDVVVSPRLLENLLSAIASEGVGMVEAKQLPIEHPKEYDEKTGDTSWASLADSTRTLSSSIVMMSISRGGSGKQAFASFISRPGSFSMTSESELMEPGNRRMQRDITRLKHRSS
jgi:GT2 family glycosyltransferase